MGNTKLVTAAVVGFAALVVILNSVFIVNQFEQALVLQFGKPIKTIQEPGLHTKIPFVQNVEYFDKRLLEFNAEPKELIAADQKKLIVDAYVRWRIINPLKFYQTVRDERIMESRINSILESSLRQVVGSVQLSDIVSDKRDYVMRQVRDILNSQTSGQPLPSSIDKNVEKAVEEISDETPTGGFGVEVVDTRVMRADLPEDNSQSIYRRMQTEREREAKELRAKGAEEAQKIRSTAEKDRTVILAEARKKSEILRGEGEAVATRTFADAFGTDKEFFEFYRTMQAYRKALNKDNTTLVLSPDSEFLKYLKED